MNGGIPMRNLMFTVMALCLMAAATGAATAQDADPPGRVARLSDVEGAVSLQPAGTQDWAAAQINRPLTTGDKLWADHGSRAELDVGAAVIRAGDSTGFSFLNLDDNIAQIQLTAGTLIVRVRELLAGQVYEVDTPNLVVTLQQAGDYRIEVNDAGDNTVVKVSEGAAQTSGAGQSGLVGSQQFASFTGTQTLDYAGGVLGGPDELDEWSAQREQVAQDSPSRQYLPAQVPGAQDLDTNGRWQDTREYGYVWTPTAVGYGWAPYRFGQWAWIAPWGWTWIDDARWGFAPFHYGRWVQWNSAWCWVPGPRVLQPVYAPALVAWIGSPGYGGAGVGWFPLGPREVFVPAYAVSSGYVRSVNITNTTLSNTIVTDSYHNSVNTVRYVNNTASGVTAVPQSQFVAGRHTGAMTYRMPGTLQVSATAPALVPTRQSVLGSDFARAVARPPAQLSSRAVLARTPPPRAPVPFERQVAALQANGGRPVARAELARLQPASAAVPIRMISRGAGMEPGAAMSPAARPASWPDHYAAPRSMTAAPPARPVYAAPPAARGLTPPPGEYRPPAEYRPRTEYRAPPAQYRAPVPPQWVTPPPRTEVPAPARQSEARPAPQAPRDTRRQD